MGEQIRVFIYSSFIRYAEHDYCHVLCQYAYQLTGLLDNVTRDSDARS